MSGYWGFFGLVKLFKRFCNATKLFLIYYIFECINIIGKIVEILSDMNEIA